MNTITHNSVDFTLVPGLTHHYASRCGMIYSMYSNSATYGSITDIGYMKTWIKDPLHHRGGRLQLVHRLIALTFVDNTLHKPDVNHLDGNKQNNSADNLMWCTKSENIRHAHDTGLMNTKSGELHHRYGKKASQSTRDKQSAAKLGKKHPKYKGQWHTPVGVFESANQAAKANNTSPTQVLRWSKSPKHPEYQLNL